MWNGVGGAGNVLYNTGIQQSLFPVGCQGCIKFLLLPREDTKHTGTHTSPEHHTSCTQNLSIKSTYWFGMVLGGIREGCLCKADISFYKVDMQWMPTCRKLFEPMNQPFASSRLCGVDLPPFPLSVEWIKITLSIIKAACQQRISYLSYGVGIYRDARGTNQ